MSIVLKILEERDAYARFHEFIPGHAVSQEEWQVVLGMKKYFDEYPSVVCVDWQEFSTWFLLKENAGFKPERAEVYRRLFTATSAAVPTATVEGIVKSLIERQYATQISDHLMSLLEGDVSKDINDVLAMMKRFEDESGRVAEDDAYVVTSDISELVKTTTGRGLNWRMPELNRAVGPLRRGDLVVFSGRPDSGKTTWMAFELSHFLTQLDDDECVVLFNNEQGGEKVKKRILQSLTEWETADIDGNPLGFKKACEDLIGDIDRVHVYDRPGMSKYHVDRHLESLRFRPGAIAFDQLWKVTGFKDAFSDTDRQTKLFGWARELSKMYCPVLAMHQADASAEGEQYIEMNQLYGSKTGVQGEADVLITMGKPNDPARPNARFLYVPKNKNAGGSVPGERHGRYEIEIDPYRATFRGFVK